MTLQAQDNQPENLKATLLTDGSLWNPDSILKYNGTFTIENERTGNHRTFKIETQKWGDEKKRVIMLLDGPNNTTDYVGFGFATKNNIRIWKKKRSPFFQKVSALIENPGKAMRSGLNFHVQCRCRRCGRALTTPDSVVSGIGPVCVKKEKNS